MKISHSGLPFEASSARKIKSSNGRDRAILGGTVTPWNRIGGGNRVYKQYLNFMFVKSQQGKTLSRLFLSFSKYLFYSKNIK